MPSMRHRKRARPRIVTEPVMLTLAAPRPGRLAAAWELAFANPVLAVIAGIGFAVSFQTISHLAATQHMPGWPVLYPLLFDAAILGFTIEARKAIDDRRSDLVPRMLAWAAAAFTVYVNAHGSPARDWLGMTLHVAAPCMWIAFLELTRWRKLRRKHDEAQDRIPLARWLADPPWRTIGMRRRMIVNNVTSYPEACSREEARLVGIDVARASLGKRWKRDAPALLRRHLKAGTLPAGVAESCATATLGRSPAVGELVGAWVADALTQPARTAASVARQKRAIEVSAALPDATPDRVPSSRQPARQKGATDNARKHARARRLLSASPVPTVAAVAAKTGLSERTVSRIKSDMPRSLHAVAE